MDKTLFFLREVMAGHGGSHAFLQKYKDYRWTYPGAEDPLAPDDEADPYAQERGNPELRRTRCFMLVKTAPDKLTAPKRKRDPISILGADWTVDANEALSGDAPVFDGVTYTASFALLRDSKNDIGRRSLTGRRSWERQISEIINKLGGKTWLISPQNDRWFYREGRVEVSTPAKNDRAELTITADCDPWKYEKYASIDEWEWDDLDLEYGIIREREDYILKLQPDEIGTVPVFPLEKREPIWLRSEHINTKAFVCWAGDSTGVQYNALPNTWLETSFVPTEERFHLNIQNKDDETRIFHVYYRGAMR